jgi:hypothetical protein
VKKKVGVFITGLIFISLAACQDIIVKPNPHQEENQGIQYLIKEGAHDSNQLPAFKQGVDALSFQAKFDSTAIYITAESNNQADINKLYGLSDCNSFHQVNSARFGWRWHNNQLEILAYTYSDKVRDFELLGTASLNAYHHYKIEFTSDSYIFSFDNKIVALSRDCSGNASGYKLYPYFGGDETAPHDIFIWIEDL